jgi:tetratricopeptide (TPR) repeat protein
MQPIFEVADGGRPSSENDRRNVALGDKKLGGNLARLERYNEALVYYQKALEMDEAALSADPDNAKKRIDLSFSLSDYGFVLTHVGKAAQALESYQRALQIREELVAADPKDERARSALATTHAKLGWVLSTMGNLTESLNHYHKAITIRDAMIAAKPAASSNRQGWETVCQHYRRLFARWPTQRERPRGSESSTCAKLGHGINGVSTFGRPRPREGRAGRFGVSYQRHQGETCQVRGEAQGQVRELQSRQGCDESEATAITFEKDEWVEFRQFVDPGPAGPIERRGKGMTDSTLAAYRTAVPGVY